MSKYIRSVNVAEKRLCIDSGWLVVQNGKKTSINQELEQEKVYYK